MTTQNNPSAAEMKVFAAKFTQDQWNYLCTNPEFVSKISENLEEAKKIAIKFYPNLKDA